MPIHDWSQVAGGVLRHFQQRWIAEIADRLNAGGLPPTYYALIERRLREDRAYASTSELDFDRRKQNFVAVRDARDDELVAVVEIVSKGNKSGRKAFDDFVRKAADILSAGVHLLVVDLQPPTPRDPSGIHGAIWDELIGEPYVGPSEKPLTLVAYESGASLRAFVEPVAVGDSLPDMPLFLAPRRHVPVPLASTYDEAFRSVPIRWRGVVESGVST